MNSDNTVGSQSKTDLAYIAGFLDGDGSLMLQLKKRQDGKRPWRFMATICFYQDSRHKTPLSWIREVLGIGYLTDRNDGMSELRINGFGQIKNILKDLLPFIRFKKVQAETMIGALELLSKKKNSELLGKDLRILVDHIIAIQNGNYVTKRKRTRKELLKVFGLTP